MIVKTIFYSFHSTDEKMLKDLETHLSSLRREGLIKEWHANQIAPGADKVEEIKNHLDESDLVLFLVSADFLASSDLWASEIEPSLERYRERKIQVLPIILSPVDWENTPFANIPCLPRNKKLITLWRSRKAAYADIVQSIREVIEYPDQKTFFAQTPKLIWSSQSIKGDRNRRSLIDRVWTRWIKGLLEPSLQNNAPISLQFSEEPGLIHNPWSFSVQELNHSLQSQAQVDRSIIQAYDDTSGALLILGEPGTGKTTSLLELARELLKRASIDTTHPIPVILNLSSWSRKQWSFDKWLVEELNEKYRVPRSLGQSWVQANMILPLLDGLDEMAPECISACIRSINIHQRKYITSLVICSRLAEYTQQKELFDLQGSITIQPLTQEQIEDYLLRAGHLGQTIRTIFTSNQSLREFVKTPLLLNIILSICREIDEASLMQMETSTIQQRNLFSQYIDKMLQRRTADRHYTQLQTFHWLAWLSRQLLQQNQTEFSPDSMQPDWLPNTRSSKLYTTCVILLVTVIGILTGIVGIGLFSNIGAGVGAGLLIGFTVFYIGGMLTAGYTRILPVESSPWEEWLSSVTSGIGIGLLVWLVIGIVILELFGLTIGMRAGLICALAFGGLVGGLATCWLLIKRFSALSKKYISGKLNQRLKYSFRNNLVFGLLGSLGSAVLFGGGAGLATWFLAGPELGMSVGKIIFLPICLISFLGVGLADGGLSYLQYIVLHFFLWKQGSIPWNYSAFLNYATRRTLLRNLGGNYIFLHRLLGEYIALTGPEPKEAIDYYGRGSVYLALEEYTEAIVDLNQAVMLDSLDSKIYEKRAEAYLALGKYQDAFKDFTQSQNLKSIAPFRYGQIEYDKVYITAQIHFRIASVCLQNHNYEEVSWYFDQARSLYAKYIWNELLLLVYKHSKTDVQVTKVLYEALKRNLKGSSNICWILGLIAIDREEYIRAEADFTQAIKLASKNGQAYCARGIVYAILKEYNQAVDDFTQAIRLAHTSTAYCGRSIVHISLKAYEQAKADMLQAFEIDQKINPYWRYVYDSLLRKSEEIESKLLLPSTQLYWVDILRGDIIKNYEQSIFASELALKQKYTREVRHYARGPYGP